LRLGRRWGILAPLIPRSARIPAAARLRDGVRPGLLGRFVITAPHSCSPHALSYESAGPSSGAADENWIDDKAVARVNRIQQVQHSDSIKNSEKSLACGAYPTKKVFVGLILNLDNAATAKPSVACVKLNGHGPEARPYER
jgi:hypothetical protein